MSVANLKEREFTSPPAGYFADIDTTFSPDGRTLAFTRWTEVGAADVYLQPVGGGEGRRLTCELPLETHRQWLDCFALSDPEGSSFEGPGSESPP